MRDALIKFLGGYTYEEYRYTHDYNLGYARGKLHGIKEMQKILKKTKRSNLSL
jgi:hypothetical protein